MAEETRLGFAFNNPDYEANDGWGAIITPDELRYVYAFGNELVATNSQFIIPETLQWYIDNAIGKVERDLKVSLYKRIYKHRPVFINGVEQERTDLEDAGTPEIDYFWEDPYDWDRKNFTEFIYIKLRNRPILSVEKVDFRDPTGNIITEMTSWRKVNHPMGSIEFFPHAGALARLPMYAGGNFFMSPVRWVYDRFPDGFYIDYTAGFESAEHLRKKYPELFGVVGMLAGISLLNDFGDGKSAAVASTSLGLDGISESLSTTQSATNALFGARILQFQKQLKDFYKENKNKYCGMHIGAL
jgi:hypothetical protein